MILTNCTSEEALQRIMNKTSIREFVVISDAPEEVHAPQGANVLVISSIVTGFPAEKLEFVKEIVVVPGSGKEVLALCALGLFSVGIPISFSLENGVIYESIYDVVDLSGLWEKFGVHMLNILARKYEDIYLECKSNETAMIKQYEGLERYVRAVNETYDKITNLVNIYTKKKLDEITQ